ncbi:MAG TPA: 50S ribosomal protein L29 [Dongiaceae bacterium]|nr:50S ribosomal protein L29 [Dongiaceae bacterium]
MAETKKTVKKAVKAAEVKTLTQLKEELVKLRADFDDARRSHRAGELVNPHTLTTQRKTIARTLTAIKQAELASQKEEN